jgi:predicted phage-related endonuclease
MIVVSCVQKSPEWFAARLGRLTSSCASDAFATIKKGESAGRRNLRIRLVLERLTGKSQETGFTTFDMERGAALEDEARRAYEARTGTLIDTVGFISHDVLMAGCSPDGLTDDGIIEIKCPKAATHLEYLSGGLPGEYLTQITHTLWITGKAWGDFVSYHPEFPEHLRLKVTRISAANLDFTAYELAVRLFLSEVDKEYAVVAALGREPEVAA